MSQVSKTNGDVDSGKKRKCYGGNDSDGGSNGLNLSSSDSDAEATEANVEVVQFDEKKAVRSMAELICKTNITPKMVVTDEFMSLMNWCNSLTRPSLEAIESECMKFYEEKKVRTIEMLEDHCGRINLSLDVLKSDYDYGLFGDKYMCLSAHFIDEDWKLRKWALYFRSFSRSDDVVDKDEDWGIFWSLVELAIENKIVTLSVANDYCFELVEPVKSHIQEKKGLQLGGQLFHVYCCEEVVMKMVQGAYDKIEKIIDKVSGLCSMKFLFPLWYLTSSKLKSELKLWSAGEYSSVETDLYDVPSPEEWKQVEGVCKIVDSLYEVSNALFQTKRPPANVYLYHLHEVRNILTQMCTDSDDFVRTLAKDMLAKFDKYWDGMLVIFAIAAALDPQFKMKYVEFVCSKVKCQDGTSQVATVLGVIRKLFDEYVTNFPEEENSESDSSSSEEDVPET